MARLNPEDFGGSGRKLSFYKMHGVDRPIVRRAGGPTKEQIRYSEDFYLTRHHNAEFSGRSKAGKWVRHTFSPIRHLANKHITSEINGLLTIAQQLDIEKNMGERSVALTKIPKLLEGFNFNKGILFDSIVTIPVACAIDRETLTARFTIPDLIPGINLKFPASYSAYSLVTTFGIMPDIHWIGYTYDAPRGYIMGTIDYQQGEWHPCASGSPATTVELKIPEPAPDNNFTLIAGIGIRFGNMIAGNHIAEVRRTGAAKILQTG